MHLADLAEVTVDTPRGGQARLLGRRLRQVEQDRGEHVVLVIQADPTDQVGGVFLLRQPTGRLTGGTTPRQDKNRGPLDALVAERIRVDRHEQVRPVVPCQLHALAQADIIVTRTGEYRAHAGLSVYQTLQPARNLQGHVLFLGAFHRTDGTRVLAAMPCVHRDHHVAPLFDIPLALGHARLVAPALVVQVDYQAMAVTGVGLEQKTLRPHRLLEIQDHAQPTVLALAMPQTLEMLVTQVVGAEVGAQSGLLEIHHQAFRTGEGKDAVFDRAVDVENQAGMVGGCPQPCPLDTCR